MSPAHFTADWATTMQLLILLNVDMCNVKKCFVHFHSVEAAGISYASFTRIFKAMSRSSSSCRRSMLNSLYNGEVFPKASGGGAAVSR